MPDYKNAKIYKIISLSRPDLVYIGATTQKLCSRFACHKDHIKRGKNCSSKIVLECEDAKIILLENYPCLSKEELSAKEYEYMNTTTCVNNRKGETLTPEGKKKKMAENYKKWYNEHKDEILQKKKIERYRDRKALECCQTADNELGETFTLP